MEGTVADKIRELTRVHLESRDGLLMGQCISAVGWIQNTVPADSNGLVELSMSDVAGPGFAVGAAVAGRRPIFVVRFQSFLWLAASPLVNYAAKSKEIFGYPCPVFVRAIAAEGGGMGPVHTNCFHSIFMHSPGMPVVAPMTPGEYEQIWNHYLNNDDPMLVSEHRRSYGNREELPDVIHPGAKCTIFAASAARFEAVLAVAKLEAKGIACNLFHVVWLKPFSPSDQSIECLKKSGCGLVLDSSYEIAGASQSLAYTLMLESGVRVQAVGQADRSPGAAKHLENGTPKADRIVDTVEKLISRVLV